MIFWHPIGRVLTEREERLQLIALVGTGFFLLLVAGAAALALTLCLVRSVL